MQAKDYRGHKPTKRKAQRHINLQSQPAKSWMSEEKQVVFKLQPNRAVQAKAKAKSLYLFRIWLLTSSGMFSCPDADRDGMRQVLVVTGSTQGWRLLPENNLDFTTTNLLHLFKIQSADPIQTNLWRIDKNMNIYKEYIASQLGIP